MDRNNYGMTWKQNDARRGGTIPTKINPKLLHDIQTALARLVTKANQHVRSKYDGGKVHGSRVAAQYGQAVGTTCMEADDQFIP